MAPIPIYFHIGFPKTATTTLQKHFFGNHPQIHYPGKSYKAGNTFDEWINAFVLQLRDQHLEYFITNKSKIREDLKRWLYLTDSLKVNLISQESVLSVSLQPSTRAPYTPLSVDPWHTLQKIARLNSEEFVIKPILTIRRQDLLLFSYYAEHFYRFRRIPITSSFKKFTVFLLSEGYYSLGGSMLEYDRFLPQIEEIFGRENTGVFVFEEFENTPESFLRRLAGFMDIDPQPWLIRISHEKSESENRRSLNPDKRKALQSKDSLYESLKIPIHHGMGNKPLRWLLNRLKPVLKRIPATRETVITADAENMEMIRAQFRDSNMRLDEARCLNLIAYEYY